MALSQYADRAAFGRLVARESASASDFSDSAAVIAYHDRTGSGGASSSGGSASANHHTSQVLPPWARAAERIAHSLHGLIPTVLVTNAHVFSSSTPFSRILRVDLLKTSGLTADVPSRAMCGLKLTALLHGWQVGALPERVLLLDHDVIVMNPRQLVRMLEPLRFYDLAGVMEGISRGWDGRDPNQRNDSLASAPDPAGRGWEVNSGVLAVRRQAVWFVRLWADEFRAGVGLYSRLTGADQSALMWVLAHEPRARLFPLPPMYNFRQPTLYSRDLPPPAAFHTRTALRSPSRGTSVKAMARIAHAVAEQAGAWPSSESSGGHAHPSGRVAISPPAKQLHPTQRRTEHSHHHHPPRGSPAPSKTRRKP